MNELTGFANQQSQSMPKRWRGRSRRQLSRNSHEFSSISASFCQIDKLRLPVIIANEYTFQATLSHWRGAITKLPNDQDV
jgi:hypothetical protein